MVLPTSKPFASLHASDKARILFGRIVSWRKEPALFFEDMRSPSLDGLDWQTNLRSSSSSSPVPFWAQFFFSTGSRSWPISRPDMLEIWCATRPLPERVYLPGLAPVSEMMRHRPDMIKWFDFSGFVAKSPAYTEDKMPWSSLVEIAKTLDRTANSTHARFLLASAVLSAHLGPYGEDVPKKVLAWGLEQACATGVYKVAGNLMHMGLAEHIFKTSLFKEGPINPSAEKIFFDILERRARSGWDTPLMPSLVVLSRNHRAPLVHSFVEKLTLMNGANLWPWQKERSLPRKI